MDKIVNVPLSFFTLLLKTGAEGFREEQSTRLCLERYKSGSNY